MKIKLAQSSASSGIYLNGGFSDSSIARLFIEFLKPGMVTIDCGAHIGEYTILFAALVGYAGRVHSFEPDPRVFAYLKENVSFNNLRNVTLKNVALSDSVGEASFILEADPTSSLLSSFSKLRHPRHEIRVHVTTLDEYVRTMGLRRVDAIKIDVEGAEASVIKGAETLLEEIKPALIFLECDIPENADWLESRLSAYGYAVHLSMEGHLHPHMIAQRT